MTFSASGLPACDETTRRVAPVRFRLHLLHAQNPSAPLLYAVLSRTPHIPRARARARIHIYSYVRMYASTRAERTHVRTYAIHGATERRETFHDADMGVPCYREMRVD